LDHHRVTVVAVAWLGNENRDAVVRDSVASAGTTDAKKGILIVGLAHRINQLIALK
jgi:hypothetical protein